MPSTFDYLVAAYLAWGLFKGYRRGAGRESYALISLLLLLALALGFRLLSGIREGMTWLVDSLPGISPVAGFVLVSFGSLLVFLLLRRKLQQLRRPARRSRLGALLGMARGLVVVLILLGLTSTLPFEKDGTDPETASLTRRMGTPLIAGVKQLTIPKEQD